MTDDKRPITPDDKVAIGDPPGTLFAPAPALATKTETSAPAVAVPPESATPPPSTWQPAPLEPRPPCTP